MLVQRIPGKLVRDPVTKELLPSEPKHVTDTPYWRRRIVKGDVVQLDERPKRESKELDQ